MGMEVSASCQPTFWFYIIKAETFNSYAHTFTIPIQQTDHLTGSVATAHLPYIGCEGTTHEFLPLPLLGLSGVTPMLEVLQGGPKVLDIVLKLVHSPEGNKSQRLWLWF